MYCCARRDGQARPHQQAARGNPWLASCRRHAPRGPPTSISCVVYLRGGKKSCIPSTSPLPSSHATHHAKPKVGQAEGLDLRAGTPFIRVLQGTQGF